MMFTERILQRLLIESKLDSLSASISRKVLENVKAAVDNVNSTPRKKMGKFVIRTLQLDEESIDGMTGGDATLGILIKVYSTVEDKVAVDASWDWEARTLDVYVNVMSNTGTLRPEHFGMLQARLYEAIRHEVEHSAQEDGDGAAAAYSAWSADPTNIEKRKAYYTEPGEVGAFTAGIYNAAKRLRKPFSDMMEESLKKIRKAMERDPNADPREVDAAIKHIRDVWTAAAEKRYPLTKA